MGVMTPSTVPPNECHDTESSSRHDTRSTTTVVTVTGKSGKGTARQTIRMDEDLWEELDAATKAARTDRSAALREFARWYVHRKGAKMPRRPSSEDIAAHVEPSEE